ncbi:MAG TPA: hypothetical protein VKW06_10725 [Candidatus Angelobacter sp.]|nr:hypothetical protein [Candidatus Angelobacter sp.]
MIIKYLLIRLVPVLLLFALGYSFFIPSAGERQFLRMEAALAKAKSYRMEESAQGKTIDHWTFEVVCPDRQHSLQTSAFAERQWDTPRDVYIEHFDVGNRHYVKYFKDADWKLDGAGRSVCGHSVPFLQDGYFPDFKHIRALGGIEKRGMDTVAGQACREWRVTFHAGNGNEKILDYCIGSDDLPRRLIANENSFRVVWTDWNQPIEIDPPEWPR